ncbi:FAD dependent oxidoreductase [Pelagophyceae sp. CCMP2097]|nr:FAD dependent oxidoreductase [Pelagophyceae sp. CCMP2097]|mmetsp:Transcript_22586/g.78421  ORF Transcript_22586/g.78421 Transcript_22586/m.78421 type:complete len:450 (-) Transcript_22586:26-1375(-)
MAALDEVYDVVVVGRGLVGAACAKYAQESGQRTALVGPREVDHDARGVWSCHGDEGRITRRLDTDAVWAELAGRSIDRYAGIESESGIKFHRARGCLAVGRKGGPFLQAVAETALKRGLELEALSQEALATKWPSLRLDASLLQDFDAVAEAGWDDVAADRPEYAALYERKDTGAGDVSPRRLLEAQVALFLRAGGECVERVAAKVQPLESDAQGHRTVSLDDGSMIRALKVIVCTNAWTNFRQLLPRKLALELTTQSTRRRVFSAADAQVLSDMPSIIVKGGISPFGKASDKFDSVYILPPTHYDSDSAAAGFETTALKIGHGKYFERPLDSEEMVLDWYRGNGLEDRRDSFARCELALVLDRLLRRPAPESVNDVSARCVIPKTPTSRPYLHLFHPSLGCCVGCNGFAAKSSDELGRLAWHMTQSQSESDWGANIPPDAFRPVFAPE